MQRALMEKTLIGQWSCPTVPAPERTMNGWFFINFQGFSCVLFSAAWKTGQDMVHFPEERKGTIGNKCLSTFFVPGIVLGTFYVGYSIQFLQPCDVVEALLHGKLWQFIQEQMALGFVSMEQPKQGTC